MKIHNKVYFSNEQYDYKITGRVKSLIKTAVDTTLLTEGFSKSAEVSVTFTDDEKIRALNRDFRGKDKSTDVLSFPMMSEDDAEGDIDMDGGYTLLGDIVISVEHALEQAINYGHSAERELAFLAVHSVLHLLGYDHERSPEEDKLMQSKQEDVLIKMGLPRGENK